MLVPCNRYLLVEPTPDTVDRGDAFVLIPESSVSQPTHSLVVLRGKASDCEKIHAKVGATLLVSTNMIEEVRVGQETYNLILENHVIGLYEGTEER